MVEVVREILEAIREHRTDDLVALVDADVVWMPVTRPARSVYVGVEGTRQMMDDFHAAWRDFELVVGAITQVDANTVVACCRLSYLGLGGTRVDHDIEPRYTFKNGRLVRLESVSSPAPC